MTVPKRQPHAVLDMPSRRLKAMKIEQLLGIDNAGRSLRILEIGCGSGGISCYFGTVPQPAHEVDAVDVVDSRQVFDGFRFTLVKDVNLPFEDAKFDVVITNHVIEHVGDKASQLSHLAEVRRVMRPNGMGYLAVPNRWQLVEPHYRLAFLSWLPHSWRTPYLRLMGKGRHYDCEPLEMGELESLLQAAGFSYLNLCVPAFHLTLALESMQSRLAHAVARVPEPLLHRLRAAIPTQIYKLQP